MNPYIHKSDCSLHNEPFAPNKDCDCGVAMDLLDEVLLFLEHGTTTTFKSKYELIVAISQCFAGKENKK